MRETKLTPLDKVRLLWWRAHTSLWWTRTSGPARARREIPLVVLLTQAAAMGYWLAFPQQREVSTNEWLQGMAWGLPPLAAWMISIVIIVAVSASGRYGPEPDRFMIRWAAAGLVLVSAAATAGLEYEVMHRSIPRSLLSGLAVILLTVALAWFADRRKSARAARPRADSASAVSQAELNARGLTDEI